MPDDAGTPGCPGGPGSRLAEGVPQPPTSGARVPGCLHTLPWIQPLSAGLRGGIRRRAHP